MDYIVRLAGYTEWKILYSLCKDDNGLLHKEIVRAAYDGSLFEKMAKEKQVFNGGDRKSEEYRKSNVPNLAPTISTNSNESKTISRLAKIAGVGKETYRMGAKVLNSDNEDVKNRVLSGETSISAGYREHPPPFDPKPVFRRV